MEERRIYYGNQWAEFVYWLYAAIKDDFVCSSCHFEQKKYRPIPRCLLPGTEVAERYVLGRVLGEGNFGITYIGWDKVLSKRVAVKEYYPTDYVSRDVLRGTDRKVYVYESRVKKNIRIIWTSFSMKPDV